MVPVPSVRIPRAPTYSGSRRLRAAFRLRGSHPLRPAFPCRSAAPRLAFRGPITPTLCRFGLLPFRSPLLGESFAYFLLLRLLRCFNSPGFSPAPMCSGQDAAPLRAAGSPIRIPPDLCVLATPRSVSPLSASFLSRQCQGIRHTPCSASSLLQYVLCSVASYFSRTAFLEAVSQLLSFRFFGKIYLLLSGFQRTIPRDRSLKANAEIFS